MSQIRLTAKFAKDLKIKNLAEPKTDCALIDDWIIDVITVQRRKIAKLKTVKR